MTYIEIAVSDGPGTLTGHEIAEYAGSTFPISLNRRSKSILTARVISQTKANAFIAIRRNGSSMTAVIYQFDILNT